MPAWFRETRQNTYAIQKRGVGVTARPVIALAFRMDDNARQDAAKGGV
jgi:hypothetical protein